MEDLDNFSPSMKISLHNHFHFNRDYTPTDVFDFMIEKDMDIATVDGYEMPDIISNPFTDMIQIIEKDNLFKEKYNISFLDSISLKVTDKEKEKSVYIINSKEIGTKENAHVEFIGYNGNIKHGNSLEETIEKGLESDAIVSVCHPFACEEKIFSNFWNNERFIDEERIKLLEKVANKYRSHICFEEFNAFLGRCLFISMKGASKRVTKFLNGLQEKRIEVQRIYGNDSHIKSKSLIKDMATVYLKIAKSKMDASNSFFLIEDVRNNIFLDNYSLSDKKYISGWHIYLGFGPDKFRAVKNKLLNKIGIETKRIGEK